MTNQRPYTIVVLAMSVDGKIADQVRSPARFGSAADLAHLERQIAQTDGVLFGNGTLNAYGTTLSVSSEELLQQRQQQGKPPQPVQIVCSGSGKINPNLRFFKQSVPRWLLTTEIGEKKVREEQIISFERILIAEMFKEKINWINTLQQFSELGLQKLAVVGGGQLVGSLIECDCIDEVWLTVCPLILGGVHAPTPVEGNGFLADVAPRLELLEVKPVEQEVFLHYRLLKR